MSHPALFDCEHLWVHRRCQVCGGALSVQHAHTYVVQRQVWIKIGATDKPRRRINELSRPAWTQHILSPRGMDWHAPLRTVVVLDGDHEHYLHDRFAEFHARGEWFWDTLAIRRWIQEVTPCRAPS